jgi:phospholipase C
MAPRNIEHVIVLMLENRSFDHLCGFRDGVDGLKGDETNLLDPSKPESDSNPAFPVNNGAPFAVLVGEGPGHSLAQTNTQLFGQKNVPPGASPTNDGFVKSYHDELGGADKIRNPTQPQIEVVMQSFAPARLPSFNALADAFCLCDHWHAEVPGPTQPNRLYMHAATSAGFAHNVWSRVFDFRTIYNSLDDAGFTWATYEHDDNEVRYFSQVNKKSDSFKLFTEAFQTDVATGALPNYAFILPRSNNKPDQMANSQHAPEDARYGDNLVADVYEALRSNDAVWKKSALIVTYDEHGGFYDHVAPPRTVNPDGINSPAPGDQASFVPPFAFDRLGLRVPAVIASPWIKQGLVDNTLYQHTSVLATLKQMFGLAAFLTKRDAGANAFDQLFTQLDQPRDDTPTTLPRAALPAITVPPSDPSHPANSGLDAIQKERVHGAHHLTAASHPAGPPPDALPQTQAEAGKFIQDRFIRHFGPHAPPGKRPRAHSSPRVAPPARGRARQPARARRRP